MSILANLSKLQTVTTSTDTPKKPLQMHKRMTQEEITALKETIRKTDRGYNVYPNPKGFYKKLRVAVNFKNEWHDFGEFKSIDVAAAVGTIVSAAFFGEKAKAGKFDAAIVEASDEFKAWMEDANNAEVIARANGEQPPTLSIVTDAVKEDDIPF